MNAGPDPGPLLRAEDSLLRQASCGDPETLSLLRARRVLGEPLAYILGWFDFRGRRFAVDWRCFITDPETTHLVDAVSAAVAAAGASRLPGANPPLLAEIGMGCGALGLSLIKENPDLRLVGLDVDERALEVARVNALAHGVGPERLDLLQSDFLSAWGDRPEPAIVFGDLPWGDDDSIYDAARPASYYRAMPAASAYPVGGPLGMHRRLLREVAGLGWKSEVFLNFGMLPEAKLHELALAEGARTVRVIQAAHNVGILQCQMNG